MKFYEIFIKTGKNRDMLDLFNGKILVEGTFTYLDYNSIY